MARELLYSPVKDAAGSRQTEFARQQAREELEPWAKAHLPQVLEGFRNINVLMHRRGGIYTSSGIRFNVTERGRMHKSKTTTAEAVASSGWRYEDATGVYLVAIDVTPTTIELRVGNSARPICVIAANDAEWVQHLRNAFAQFSATSLKESILPQMRFPG
ncbi:MAG TPA: hypothetical protein VFG51_03460 [Candidatus Saccharimonadia bacterium]|nr:hypothetical protein [Candidatus Saccharimonadia bacterium]